MKISKQALLEILSGIEGEEVEFFPSSVNYGAVDPEAVMVGRNVGLHQQGVFVKAAA